AAATAEAPEQICVLIGTRAHHLAIRRDEFGSDQVVACEAVLAGETTEPATQRQPADTCLRYRAQRRREPERQRGAVELADQHAGLHLRAPASHVDATTLHQRQIDHESGVANGMAWKTVAATAHCDRQLMCASKADRMNDVLRVPASHEQRRSS